MAGPYLIVFCGPGDSNAGHGQYQSVAADGTTDPNVFQYGRFSGTIAASKEMLENIGMGNSADGRGAFPNTIGHTFDLCKRLSQGGMIPDGYQRILIVPVSAAGTGLATGPGEWRTNGSRVCLDDSPPTASNFTGFYGLASAAYAAAIAADPKSRVWFFCHSMGENDAGTQAAYEALLGNMYAEIKSRLPTAWGAPIFIAGEPPNRSDPNLGNSPNAGVTAALQNCAAYLPNSLYIDTSDLTYPPDNSNGFVHHSGAAHRGGKQYLAGGFPADWDSGTTYNALDQVMGSNNLPYMCRFNGVTGDDPTINALSNWWRWGGSIQRYDATKTYAASEYAGDPSDPSGPFVYKSRVGSNLGNTPHLSPTQWLLTPMRIDANVTNPISLREYNNIGNVRWSMRANWSAHSAPGNISDLAVITGNAKSGTLSFNFTPSSDGTQHEYQVATHSGAFGAATQLYRGQVIGLTPSVSYDVQVRGKNIAGVGSWSNLVTGTAA